MMEESESEVCRLCLLLVTNYEVINDTQEEMLQIVIPELVRDR